MCNLANTAKTNPIKPNFEPTALKHNKMHRQMGKKRKIPCLLQSLAYNVRLYRHIVVGEFFDEHLKNQEISFVK